MENMLDAMVFGVRACGFGEAMTEQGYGHIARILYDSGISTT